MLDTADQQYECHLRTLEIDDMTKTLQEMG